MMTLEKFEEASELVKKVTNPTKLIYSEYLSAQTGAKVYLKPENMQHTGAYKIRGAYYKISTLTDEERSRGLITASAGNHAQGVAFAAKQFGCKATIVMPTVTPLIKVNRTKSFGADVVLHGDVYDDAYAYACKLAEENGYTFVHPFNDLDVATGQGTIAMEIVQELPTVDYILAPIGGGGLITGVSTLAKMLNPKIKVIGVEPSEAASMTAALKAGEPVELPSANTIADGTAVKTPGSVILAGILLKLGTYGFLRFSLPLFTFANFYYTPFVYTISILGLIYSSLVAIRQTDLKRIVAYASIAHMNLIMIGLYTNIIYGIEGSLLQMFSHGLVSGALFLVVGILYERYHTRLIK